jgi:hypothetical protein
METTMKGSKPVPKWLHWVWDLTWYEWLGWIMECSLLFLFLSVVYTQFAEDEPRAGWVMLLITILFCQPGIWILLGYKPQPKSKFGKYDKGLIICFAIWGVLLALLVGWEVQF